MGHGLQTVEYSLKSSDTQSRLSSATRATFAEPSVRTPPEHVNMSVESWNFATNPVSENDYLLAYKQNGKRQKPSNRLCEHRRLFEQRTLTMDVLLQSMTSQFQPISHLEVLTLVKTPN
jgi:hypothetical protein